MATAEGRVKSSNNKRPAQELDRSVLASSQANNSSSHPSTEATQNPVPLKYVINEAVKRWFEDTLEEALRGDVKQQALLGQMYAEGYGCEKDPKASKEWIERASSRGYRMQGVYCEL
ncbi:hypothetical protein CEUSTIGMA_g111.t1 [Chlamydomonas eustigma]|uniref:Uncharacterized protein n=1 Tax=Chlamydomonas eustigma TaxID=1157962 RepID=A0A250WP97_9CHLO|nr:hypothetical protein CEUSTIGMA_g111.t1 [Chlamydomonas eustigma]|eukprot:GAX72655.1 hypothetical protein CEUSTIGMA_g111.t1 [Chlamydomonas eustigma]